MEDRNKLFYYIKEKELGNIRRFLEDNGGIEIPDEDGFTPLQYAVYQNQDEVVSLLINSGADVNGTSSDKSYTPLQTSLISGHFEVFKCLCWSGADAEARDDRGDTALHYAARYGRSEEAYFLIKNNFAKIDVRNKAGDMPVHIAAAMWDVPTLDVLLSLKTRNAGDAYDSTPLSIASFNGRLEAMVHLIEYGVDLHSIDKSGKTALEAADDNEEIYVSAILRAALAKK